MVRILIVSIDNDSLTDFKAGLELDDVQISWVDSCNDVFSRLKEEKFDLIVTDENITDMNGIECIEKLILFNPLLNCAAISSLSPDDFHEKSEGLGILMQLPKKPSTQDGIKLLEHLNTILKLIK